MIPRHSIVASVFAVVAATGIGCAAAGDPTDEAARQALQRSIDWLDASPPDPSRSKLGDLGMDAWSWAQIARLHSDPAVRQRAGNEARLRLGRLEPVIEPTPTALSWWAVLLRSMDALGMDTSPYIAALSKIDLEDALSEMNPTTALWTGELLRFAGVAIKADVAATEVASGAAASDWSPTVRAAYAIYHEIAAATDLGRVAPEVFNEQQLAFARGALPRLLAVCRQAEETDAAAEVLIAAALLDQRELPYYRDGIRWLLSQQRADGTYRRAQDRARPAGPSSYRHGVLIGSWAVLEMLAQPSVDSMAASPGS
jgi:hypothetical protein